MEEHTAYDYRRYDHVWQRVAPGCDPYGDAVLPDESAMNPQKAMTLPASAAGETDLPGAQADPCCMGSGAMESLEVLEGFIEEELAQRRCYMALAARLCHGGAARLLHSLAKEKQEAARELKSAYFLITGACYENIVSVDHLRWSSAANALRSCYHREACNGFNYRRAADETVDPCLQKLFGRLADQSFARADALMELLGHMIC